MSYNENNVPESIKTLLNELYSINPELKQDEQKIINVIHTMQANKPNVVIDEEFKNHLKRSIIQNYDQKAEKSSGYWSIIKNALFYGAGVVTAGFIILSAGMNTQIAINTNNTPLINTGAIAAIQAANSSISFKTEVIKSDTKNGFGKITLSNAPDTATKSSSEGLIAGNQPNIAPMGRLSSESNVAVADMKMIAPYPNMYPYINYSYTGTLPEFDKNLIVYKKNIKNQSDTSGILSMFNIEGFNIQSLQNAGITNLSISENKDFGYIVTIDFVNGNVSMYQNWEKWKVDFNQPVKEKIDTVELLSISKEFFNTYGIDLSSYGTGLLIENNMVMPMMAREDGSVEEVNNQYIPEQYSLVFPKLVNGKEIYEEYGGVYGLNITIDARTKKVSSFYGYDKFILEEATYSTITDNETINNIIKFGGRYETMQMPEQNKKEIELTNPRVELVRMYSYDNNISSEYLVPSYVFDVVNSENIYTPKNIIVPLVKDFANFEKYQNIEPQPILYDTMSTSVSNDITVSTGIAE